MNSELATWRVRYEGLGLSPIPVRARIKAPVCPEWQLTPAAEQWAMVGSKFDGNIGLAMVGDGKAAIDCDLPPTTEAIRRHLDGLGMHPPYVDTPGGGCHFHVNIAGAPDDLTYRLLLPPLKGELRYQNCQAVSPSSTYEGRQYIPRRGFPEAIPDVPPIQYADLAMLVAAATKPPIFAAPPVPILRRDIPAWTAWLLKILPYAGKGQPIGKYRHYPSRSEAEAAVVAGLILTGRTYPEIRQVFDDALPGHYRGYKTAGSRGRYLDRVYRWVLGTLADTPERARLVEWYQAAELSPWPGRAGAFDRACYLSLVALSWQAGCNMPYASTRDIAELCASTPRNVCSALRRLENAGWVVIYHPPEKSPHQHADTIRVLPFTGENAADRDCTQPLTSSYPLKDQRPVSCVKFRYFLWDGEVLGQQANMLYSLLDGVPRKAKMLAAWTGKHRHTAERTLHRLEAVGLAQRVKGGWVRGSADVGEVAKMLGCEDRAARRHEKHQMERERYRELLGNAKQKRQQQEADTLIRAAARKDGQR